jgi:hypothetical protein
MTISMNGAPNEVVEKHIFLRQALVLYYSETF